MICCRKATSAARIVKEKTVVALKIPRSPIGLALVLALAACHPEAPKTEDVRPVRALRIAADNIALSAEFAGEVRPRVESRLGFQVGGKIVARKVDVGAMVKKGQVLMQLDPQDLRLGEAQARASLTAAATTRDLARSELKRYMELFEKNFISRAVLDAKVSAFRAAQANVDAAQAALRGQSNQARYATLVADIVGVVTAVNAEVGQVVAPGTPVVQVAGLGEKEIVIGIPEDKVDAIRKIDDVTVHLWADPQAAIPGKIREIAPMADPQTRTYTVKVSMQQAPAAVRLGMTATVQFTARSAHPQVLLPLTALFQDHGRTAVWLVEHGKVTLAPVQLGGTSGNDVVVASGVQPGQTVVTAGVNQLKDGQQVKVLGVDVPAPTESAAGEAQ
jgi:RND family efflux transporter MFP subunit